MLPVPDAEDEDAACMRPLLRRPVPQDGREVGDVARDEDAPLQGGQLEDALVGQPFERALLVDRTDVVPLGAQHPANGTAGHMGVEKKSQALSPRT